LPPKIRELIADLKSAGFVAEPGKGSHRNFSHPSVKQQITISGQLGSDAKPYQIKVVKRAIEEAES
jgi:predicted RNA binding protein YcfA (HicA-like mRNA interferase family)